MKKPFVSSFILACAFSAVACSQGPGEDPGVASSEALVYRCAGQTNATAPTSGSATYLAHGSQYSSSACGAFAVDVTNNRSLVATATLSGTSAISAAQCATIVADLRLVDYVTIVNDCSDQPRGCKPSVRFEQTVLGETKVSAAMVNTSTGPQCQLPATALSKSWVASSDTETVKLLASAHQNVLNGAYPDLLLTVTAH